ncbi:hypothetical protein AB4068_15485 [Arthrobacter sp. 2RAF22]
MRVLLVSSQSLRRLLLPVGPELVDTARTVRLHILGDVQALEASSKDPRRSHPHT